MGFSLQCEESLWHRSEFTIDSEEDSDLALKGKKRSSRDVGVVEDEQNYYWVESTDRDEVLAVPDFMTGEEALVRLEEEDLTFEEFVEQDENGCKIVEDRQKVYGVFY